MTPTPDDIRKAREICKRVSFPQTEGTLYTVAQALAEEREAERERCAGIAARNEIIGELDEWAKGYAKACRDLAYDIRRSEP